MKALIVFDSQFGNTQKIAETITQTLEGRITHVRDFKKEMFEGTTLLVVGCPIIGWRPSEATNVFLASLPAESLKEIDVAAFDTRIKLFFSGDAAGKVDKQLVILGGKSVSVPGKFYVKGKEGPLAGGELEKAKAWAEQLLKNYKEK